MQNRTIVFGIYRALWILLGLTTDFYNVIAIEIVGKTFKTLVSEKLRSKRKVEKKIDIWIYEIEAFPDNIYFHNSLYWEKENHFIFNSITCVQTCHVNRFKPSTRYS